MKAEQGRTYAQIVNGRCHWKFVREQLPEWNNDDAPAVDITDLDPQPAIGSRYVDGAFLPAHTPEEIAAIEALAVKARLQELDRQSIRALREYVAAKIDAPLELKAIETAAAAEREKLALILIVHD